MARNLAHDNVCPTDRISGDKSEKSLLNRREYLQVGGVAGISAVGINLLASEGSAGTDEGGEAFVTDFSEYND